MSIKIKNSANYFVFLYTYMYVLITKNVSTNTLIFKCTMYTGTVYTHCICTFYSVKLKLN